MTTSRRGLLAAMSGGALAVGVSLVVAAQVPTHEEPLHHLVFEDETFRVLEPRIDPGETTLDHVHSQDAATVCISGSTMRNRLPGAEWGEPASPCQLGEASVSERAGRPMTHQAQNLGSNPLRVVAVESLKESGWSSTEPVSAQHTTVLKESRAFRIYEVRLGAGETTSHVHHRPTVAVLVSGNLISERQNPKEYVHLDQPGRWSLVAIEESHTLSSGPAGGVVAYEIEVR
jgi:hypothetical protein